MSVSFYLVSSKIVSLIRDGKLKYNSDQERVALSFDRLLNDLYKRKKFFEGGFFSFWKKLWRPPFIKGIYLYGDVGQGKSMLMNLFFELAPTEKKCKRHFYEFMKDVHCRIIFHRKQIESGAIRESDPMPLVANSIASEVNLLCFDEFMVTNIADAVILSRLFSELFLRGCVVVVTSNFIPDNLYKDEINRDVFMPFINILKKELEVISLDSGQDYRRRKEKILPFYMSSLDSHTETLMNKLWDHMRKGQESPVLNISAKGGYKIHVPSSFKRVSRFSFFDLCDRSFSANDFVEIAMRFDVVFIDNIPFLKGDRKDWIRRFIMLIDVFYEYKVCLIVSSEVDINNFFSDQLGTENFEFQRTISRLFEMFSVQYVSKCKIVMDAYKVLLLNKV